MALVLDAEEEGVELLRRRGGDELEAGEVEGGVIGEDLAAEGAEGVGKPVLHVLENCGVLIGGRVEIDDGKRLDHGLFFVVGAPRLARQQQRIIPQ